MENEINMEREYGEFKVNGSKGRVNKIVLMTLPEEGQFVNWTTPNHFKPKAVKYMPLGILSLASNLPKDTYDIKLLDASSHGWSIEETIQRIESEKPDVLGITSVDRKVWALNRILRETSASYKAVGGPHVTHYGDSALKNGADAVFIGPLAKNEFCLELKTGFQCSQVWAVHSNALSAMFKQRSHSLKMHLQSWMKWSIYTL